jgi:hypothetical protein
VLEQVDRRPVYLQVEDRLSRSNAVHGAIYGAPVESDEISGFTVYESFENGKETLLKSQEV